MPSSLYHSKRHNPGIENVYATDGSEFITHLNCHVVDKKRLNPIIEYYFGSMKVCQ